MKYACGLGLMLATGLTACGGDENDDMTVDAATIPDAAVADASEQVDAGDIDAQTADAAIIDESAPEVAILFPPLHALTDSDTIAVRGTARDDIGMAEVTANQTATSSDNDYTTWKSDIALQPGPNDISITGSDLSGNRAATVTSYVTVSRERFLLPQAVAVDRDDQRLLVIDIRRAAIVAVRLNDGTRTLLSGDGAGSGESLESPVALTVEAAEPAGGKAGRALVLDNRRKALYAVALDSGERAILSRFGLGSGPSFDDPVAVCIDDTGAERRALVLDGNRLMAVHLQTGDREVISDSGISLDFPQAMVLDGARGRVLVADSAADAVVAIQLADGARTVLSGPGDGPNMIIPRALAVDSGGVSGDRLLVVDEGAKAVFAIALNDGQSGQRTVLSDLNPGGGEGVEFDNPVGLAVYGDQGYVVDSRMGAVIAVTLSDDDDQSTRRGDRVLHSNFHLGAGPTTKRPQGVVIDTISDTTGDTIGTGQSGMAENQTTSSVTGRALVLDDDRNALMAVDLATGHRAVISGPGVGEGVSLFRPLNMALDTAGKRVLVVDDGLNALIAIDLAEGHREVISNVGRGTGDGLLTPTAVVLDAARNRALVADSDRSALIAIDLASGDRVPFQPTGSGSGDQAVALDEPVALAIDPAGERVFIADTGRDAVLVADLPTGARQLVADAERGSGEIPSAPAALAFDDEAQRVLLWDEDAAALLSVDVSTGDRTPLSHRDIPGLMPLAPRAAAWHAELGWLLVTDSELRALWVIDGHSGHRVLLSR